MSFIKDPCGIVCISITYLSIAHADYVVITKIVIQTMQNSIWGPINAVLFNTIILFLIIAHLKAVLCDPGLVEIFPVAFPDIHSNRNIQSSDEEWTVCARCETYRPPRAHHCRICRRCIRRMDHHCPWINVNKYIKCKLNNV